MSLPSMLSTVHVFLRAVGYHLRRMLDTAADYQPQPDALAAELEARRAAGVASPLAGLSPCSAIGSPPATGRSSTSGTPALRRPRPRSMSATPLYDAATMQRLRFSASKCVRFRNSSLRSFDVHVSTVLSYSSAAEERAAVRATHGVLQPKRLLISTTVLVAAG